MITFGQLLSVIFVFFVRPNWRAMLGCAAIPAILQFIGMLYLPESPRWLGKVDRPSEAKQVLKRVYKLEYLEEADMELIEEVEKL